MKRMGLFKRAGKVPNSFFFEKPNKTMSYFRSAFQSTLSNTLVKLFLFCVIQIF